MATPGIRDFHRRLASHFYGIPESDVTREQRTASKIRAFEAVRYPTKPGQRYTDRFMDHATCEGRSVLTPENAAVVEGLLEMLRTMSERHPDLMDVKGLPYTSPLESNFQFGVYDHLKGGVYLAESFSYWSGANGIAMEQVLSYVALEGEHAGKKFTRPVDEWCEVVVWPDGKYRSRYVYRGPAGTLAPSFKVYR